MNTRRSFTVIAMSLALTAVIGADAPKPTDESRRLPKANLVNSEVIPTALMGKSFMPGGTVGHYKKAKTEYDVFLAKLASPTAAASALLDWRKTMPAPKFVASFGGYFGDDSGKPTFVFTKGPWVAGIKGLPQDQADLQARVLAGQIQ